ncbi:MAG: esterase [Herpetosiphonaceae bacterium]|nr:esterase [Herpetosiphonaceae bacterium]
MRRMKRCLVILVCIFMTIVVLSCGLLARRRALRQQSIAHPAPATQSGVHTLQHGTYLRTYELHVPPSLPANRPVPLVLVFHGGSGQGKSTEGLTGFNQTADKQGFIVAYPDGVGRRWRDQPELTPDDKAVDDVGFASALIDQISHTFQIAPNRIYSTGISNGAGFSYRLACELSDKIAAIGPVAGAIGVEEVSHCNPPHPVAVIDFHGTADPIIHYTGGVVTMGKNAPTLLSTPDTVARWRQIDGCPPPGPTETLPRINTADTTSVDRQLTGPCRDDTAVDAYTINGGGHTWPSGPQYMPAFVVGKVSRQIIATDLIWDFFSRHPKQ